MNKELPPPSQNPIPEVVNPAPTLPDGRRRSSKSLARIAARRAVKIIQGSGMFSPGAMPNQQESDRWNNF